MVVFDFRSRCYLMKVCMCMGVWLWVWVSVCIGGQSVGPIELKLVIYPGKVRGYIMFKYPHQQGQGP